jgi:hypothetical protein
MSDEPRERKIQCATHGEKYATFVCRHLADGGKGLGVSYDTAAPEPWPDLVCRACSEEPQWTEEQALERIRLLCAGCWENTFGANTGTHHPDPEDWLHDALHRTMRRQDAWTEAFGIARAAHYRYGIDDEPPWLGFGPTEGRYDVMCEPAVIGSISHGAGTWLWGWANDWWQPSLTRDLVRVKRAGERLGIEKLWRSSSKGDEELGWQLSAAALDLMPDYEGIYRSPTQGGGLFLAVRRTRRTA